jgi:Uma2 family endonuclease
MTLEEFLALPEEKPYLELIHGEVEQKPVGKNPHAYAQITLAGIFIRYADQYGGMPFVEGGVRFAGDQRNLRVPDVTYFGPGQRLDMSADYPLEAPVFAAEIRSRGQTLHRLRDRLAFLREKGTRGTLLVDPDTQTVEVTDEGMTWLASPDDVVTLKALPGFSFRAGDLFV